MHQSLISEHIMLHSILTFVVFSLTLHLSHLRCGFKDPSGENVICSLLPAHPTKHSLFIEFYRVFLQKHYRSLIIECQHFDSWSELEMSQISIWSPHYNLPSVHSGRLEDHQRMFMLVKTAAWNILIRKSKGLVFCGFFCRNTKF